jgi:hypothetical protein
MRASPAFQIIVRRCGAWRAALGVLMPLGAASLAAWWAGGRASVPWTVAVPLMLLCLAVLGGVATLVHCPGQRLRWDTQRWTLAPASAHEQHPSPGRLIVAIDLGSWILLKFEHDVATRWRRASWLPVQRRGHEAQWHAFRCAVYFSRSAPGHAAGPNSAISPESQE